MNRVKPYFLKYNIKSNGTPIFAVWALNIKTHKWDCWGEVHSPQDYPDMLEKINLGYFFHSRCAGNKYEKVLYLENDGNHNPNRLSIA